MFREYPYLNLQDLNLDYILRKIREMQSELNNFVVTNAIKYADPIDWNITTQYEKNTVVIDANSGIAYLSVQPVPSGVIITNTDYWTVVFDLSMFIDKNAKNLTDHVEGQTNTATFNSSVGDWLVWYDVLYRAITNINAGDAYVVNSNIEKMTIEDVVHIIFTEITNVLDGVNHLKFGITPYTETTNPSNYNMSEGDMFWYEGELMQALANISIGDTLVLNTNYERINVSGEIQKIRVNVGNNTASIGSLNTSVGNILTLLNKTNAADHANVLTVGAVGCNFTTINDAITYANQYATNSNRVTIVVTSGTYNEQIKLIPNHGLDFMGIGEVIVRGSYTYPDAPLYVNGPINVTNMKFFNDISPSDSHAYALHSDAQDLQSLSDSAGDMYFRDCYFISISHAGVGIGLGSGTYVHFDHCLIQNTNDNGYPAFIGHNYPHTANYSFITFNNCEINATSNVQDVYWRDEAVQNSETAQFQLQFVECTTRHRRGNFGVTGGSTYTNYYDLAQNDPNCSYYPESYNDPYGGTPFATKEGSVINIRISGPLIFDGNNYVFYQACPYELSKYSVAVNWISYSPIDPNGNTPSTQGHTVNKVDNNFQVVFNSPDNVAGVYMDMTLTLI